MMKKEAIIKVRKIGRSSLVFSKITRKETMKRCIVSSKDRLRNRNVFGDLFQGLFGKRMNKCIKTKLISKNKIMTIRITFLTSLKSMIREDSSHSPRLACQKILALKYMCYTELLQTQIWLVLLLAIFTNIIFCFKFSSMS